MGECPYCHDTGRRWQSGRWPHVKVDCNHQPAETPKEEGMKFEVELIEGKRCIIPMEGNAGLIVTDDDLGASLRSIKERGKNAPAPKKPRTRRTKEQVAAAKAAKEAAKGNPEA